MFIFKNSITTTLVKYLPTLLLFAFVLIFAEQAWAAECGADKDGGLGSVVCNTIKSFEKTPGLFAGLSYLFGLVLGFWGILKLKDHVENPNQTQIWDPIKRFIAGGAFLSLPMMTRVVYETVAKGQTTLEGTEFNTSGVSAGGLDAKLVALMKDIWEPLQWLFAGFGYIAGVILLLIGISRLLKTEQEGARGPMGLGTIVTFIVAGILLSLNRILGAAVNSVFGGKAANNAALTYTDGMDAAAQGHANAVIGAIMAFVAVIGWISFIRGFFIMRGVAEGNSQASAMAGVTHIIGGAIAVNLGGFIKAVQNTLGITEYGLKISSLEAYTTVVTFIV